MGATTLLFFIFYSAHIIACECGTGRGGAVQRSAAWRVLLGCLSGFVFHFLRDCLLQKCPPSYLCLGKGACHCQAVESSTVLSLPGQPHGTCRDAEHLFVCNSPPLLHTFVVDIVAVTVHTLSHWLL